MYVNYNRFTIAASCTHVSAVLHALNGLKQLTLQPQLLDMPVEEADNNEIPSTSLLCKWNVPKGTKEFTNAT